MWKQAEMSFDLGSYYSSTFIDSRRCSAKRVLCASWAKWPLGASAANEPILGLEHLFDHHQRLR